MKSRFETVIVIGNGKTAGDVLRHVAEQQKTYGYGTVFIEYETHAMSKQKTLCQEIGAVYEQIADKRKLTERFMGVRVPTLIVSAGNYYLFPREVVEKPALEIINFHSALLPKFPGRNAQSWAIFEGEKMAGATWHYVTAGVDNGAIIAQRGTPVTEDVRAYELTRDIMAKASEAFRAFFEELLVRHIEGRPQPEPVGERKIYYSWELPGGGVCSVDDPAEYIYRVLRAMDYGRNDIFPPVRIRLADGAEAEAIRYRKEPAEHVDSVRRTALDTEKRLLYLALSEEYELAIKLNLHTKGETDHGTENT